MDTKAKIILDLVLSLNAGDSYYVDERVNVAIEQYEKLVKAGIIEEVEHAQEYTSKYTIDPGGFVPPSACVWRK